MSWGDDQGRIHAVYEREIKSKRETLAQCYFNAGPES